MSDTEVKTEVLCSQQLRKKRLLIAAINYPIYLTAVFLLEYLGFASSPRNLFPFLLIAGLLITVSLYGIISNGLNLKLKDRSMLYLLIILGTVWGWVPYLLMPDVRSLLFILYIPVFSFGALRLSHKEYFRLYLLVFFLFTTTLFVESYWLRPELDLRFELFRAGCYLAVLGWIVYLGSLVSKIQKKLRQRNYTDDLTRQFNRRYAFKTLEFVHGYCQRYDEIYSLVMIDLDNFKDINDNYGHPIGDKVLRKFAELAHTSLRDADVVLSTRLHNMEGERVDDPVFARFGGEEFVIILPNLNQNQAKACVERFKRTVKEYAFTEEHQLKLTFSAGIGTYIGKESLDGIIQKTDFALYQAKKEGRDTVKIAS